MNLEQRIVRAVALESDRFYEDAEGFGSRAAQALAGKRAQITGLESVANGTQKVSDVFDYLKLRTVRQREWQQGDLGRELLRYLEQDLRQRRDALCAEIDPTMDDYRRQEVYLRLIRAFVAQIAAQFEFALLA